MNHILALALVELSVAAMYAKLRAALVCKRQREANWSRLCAATANLPRISRPVPEGVVDSQMAREMDAKVDDGRPQSGSVRTSDSSCTTGSLSASSADPSDRYLVTTIKEKCEMVFEL